MTTCVQSKAVRQRFTVECVKSETHDVVAFVIELFEECSRSPSITQYGDGRERSVEVELVAGMSLRVRNVNDVGCSTENSHEHRSSKHPQS